MTKDRMSIVVSLSLLTPMILVFALVAMIGHSTNVVTFHIMSFNSMVCSLNVFVVISPFQQSMEMPFWSFKGLRACVCKEMEGVQVLPTPAGWQATITDPATYSRIMDPNSIVS